MIDINQIGQRRTDEVTKALMHMIPRMAKANLEPVTLDEVLRQHPKGFWTEGVQIREWPEEVQLYSPNESKIQSLIILYHDDPNALGAGPTMDFDKGSYSVRVIGMVQSVPLATGLLKKPTSEMLKLMEEIWRGYFGSYSFSKFYTDITDTTRAATEAKTLVNPLTIAEGILDTNRISACLEILVANIKASGPGYNPRYFGDFLLHASRAYEGHIVNQSRQIGSRQIGDALEGKSEIGKDFLWDVTRILQILQEVVGSLATYENVQMKSAVAVRR